MSRRKTFAVAILAFVLAASLPLAALAGAAEAAHGPGEAVAAKKKHTKKRKKRRKKNPAAPAVPAPATPKPVDLNPCPGDDPFEPDDALEQAFVLPYPGNYQNDYDRFLCPADTDYFKITVPAHGYYAITAQAFEAIDPSITIYGGDSPVVIDQHGYGAAERTAINNGDQPAPVTRWIGVSANPGDTGPYLLKGYET